MKIDPTQPLPLGDLPLVGLTALPGTIRQHRTYMTRLRATKITLASDDGMLPLRELICSWPGLCVNGKPATADDFEDLQPGQILEIATQLPQETQLSEVDRFFSGSSPEEPAENSTKSAPPENPVSDTE